MTNTATNTAMSAPFGEGDFRVGRVLSQSTSVLQRSFLTVFLVGAIAYLPIQLLLVWLTSLTQRAATPAGAGAIPPAQIGIVALGLLLATIVFSMLSQAIILHIAFQNIRNRPASLFEAFKVGLRRFIPLLLLAIVIGILMMLVMVGLGIAAGATMFAAGAAVLGNGNTIATVVTAIVFVILGFVAVGILYTMWFVSVAACVVDRRWPFSALGRSAQLTKGHRWRIFGMILLLFVASLIVSIVIELVLRPFGNTILSFLGSLAWSAIWGAFYAIVVAVSYHDLRVAKEGMDIEQIVAVFD
jgi:hypothetical protein